MTISLEKEFLLYIHESFRDSISVVCDAADKYNIELFLIGGVVRDLILGNKIKDIDIAIKGDAVEFAQLLENKYNCKIVSYQENLRTAKVEFPSKAVIDFASTREERYASSGILPEAFNFGCELENDIKRRDFTINTLALSLSAHNRFSLIDFCGGYEDIKKRKIRILHDKSFVDDPSRIIRALKFKVRFGFDIEEKTYCLMREYLENVNHNMPAARIKNELKEYFIIKSRDLYSLIINTGAYKLISDNPVKEINVDTIELLYSFNLFNENELWFVYIVLLLVYSEYSAESLNMTAFEKKVIKETANLLKSEVSIIDSEEVIYNIFNNLTDLSIAAYYLITRNPAVEKFLNALKDIKVLVNGKDLIELGFVPSPYFNEIFNSVLKEKLKGNLLSKEEEIKFIKQFIKKEE